MKTRTKYEIIAVSDIDVMADVSLGFDYEARKGLLQKQADKFHSASEVVA